MSLPYIQKSFSGLEVEPLEGDSVSYWESQLLQLKGP